MKRSIRNQDYDYRYYEEGPYGEKKKEPHWFDSLKNLFRKWCINLDFY